MFLRISTEGLLVLGLLSALVLAPANAEVVAQSAEVPTLSDVEEDPGNLETASPATETANYSDGKVSIDYPAAWQVEISETGEVGIANIPQTPMDLVETRLYRVDAPPGPLVDANIDSFIEEGAAVSRYRSVTIDDQSALVMWLAERPGELTSAIATFIGYGDETIFLFSRYSPENPMAEDEILSLHGSFSNLAAAGDADLPEEDSSAESAVSIEDEEPVLPTEELPLQNEEFQL